MTFNPAGSIALVTGANRGIGAVITDALIDAGATKVYAAVRDVDSAASLIEKHGDKIEAIEVDLTKPQTIQAASQKASDVTLVINNAGVLKTAKPLDDDALDALQFEIDVNVYGLIRMAQAFAPVLKSNGGGALVQLNSVASLRSFPDFSTYCASKAAAYSMTQALQIQLAEQGTQVLSVHPGPIDTDMAATAGLEESDPPEVVANGIIDALKSGEFHLFPDTVAKELWQAYESFATEVIEGRE